MPPQLALAARAAAMRGEAQLHDELRRNDGTMSRFGTVAIDHRARCITARLRGISSIAAGK